MGKHVPLEELVGTRLKSLIVYDVRKEVGNKRILLCRCDCGEKKEIQYNSSNMNKLHFCDCTARLHQKQTIGDRYNDLTIIDLDKDVKTNVITMCECGTIKSHQHSVLIRGLLKTCGCASKKKDTIGEQYGKLTIIGDADNRKPPNGKAEKRVKVYCECGIIKEVGYKELKRGNTKSCGCLAKSLKTDINKNNKFNYWTILSEGKPLKYANSSKSIRTVNVECVCGKNKENVILTSITQGNSKSCGCQGLPKKVKIEKELLAIPTSTEYEKWKEASGFEGYYISDKGNVFSSLGKRCYINTKSKVAVVINNSEIIKTLNIAKVLYKTFVSDWNEDEYSLLYIDENRFNPALDNLFLARITKSKEDWVSKALSKMISSAREKLGQRHKIITLRRKDIIEQYIKQEGLSTFLKLPMDLTGVDNLLGISVDRIDNDKDYIPGNITLVTRFENMGRRSATFDECMSFCAPLVCNR